MAIPGVGFTVFEGVREIWGDVLRIIEKWGLLASEKSMEAKAKGIDSNLFDDCKTVCEITSDVLRGSRVQTLLLCIDSKGDPRAIAFYEKRINTISWLVSHPNHIKHPLNIERVSGAASAIIEHLAQGALIRGLPLRVSSFSGALLFYQKLGFEFEEDRGAEELRMILTVDKIRTQLALV